MASMRSNSVPKWDTLYIITSFDSACQGLQNNLKRASQMMSGLTWKCLDYIIIIWILLRAI